MNTRDLESWLPELEAFHARFGSFFCRTEGRAAAQRYLGGLLLPLERKNVENIAEQVDMPIRGLQQFISVSPWDDEGCIDEVQRFVGEHLGADDGVLILDDTGFAKKASGPRAWDASTRALWAGPTTARSACSSPTPPTRDTRSSIAGCT